jgi:hypothetical protein
MMSNKKFDDFSVMSNTVLSHTSNWFTCNKLVLNLDEAKVIKFVTYKSPQCDLKIAYDDKYIEENKYKIPWSTN